MPPPPAAAERAARASVVMAAPPRAAPYSAGAAARYGPELAQHAQAGLPPALAPAYSACAPYPALHTAIPRVSATAIAVPRGFDESFVWQI